MWPSHKLVCARHGKAQDAGKIAKVPPNYLLNCLAAWWISHRPDSLIGKTSSELYEAMMTILDLNKEEVEVKVLSPDFYDDVVGNKLKVAHYDVAIVGKKSIEVIQRDSDGGPDLSGPAVFISILAGGRDSPDGMVFGAKHYFLLGTFKHDMLEILNQMMIPR